MGVRIIRNLGKISPFSYVVAYVVMILLFSCVYYSLPSRSFFHSTAKFEYLDLNEDANFLLRHISEHMRQSFVSHYGSALQAFDGWRVDVNELDLSSLNVANFPLEISFKVSMPTSHEVAGSGPILSVITAKVTVALREMLRVADQVIFFVKLDEFLFPIIAGVTPVPSSGVLFVNPQFRAGQFSSAPDTPVLAVPIDLHNSIIGFGQGYRGFPDKVSGHWIRMLYLSAGIASSNVFGDISPLTRTARAFVVAQTFTAIVIVSLFFNSLAAAISRQDYVERVSKRESASIEIEPHSSSRHVEELDGPAIVIKESTETNNGPQEREPDA